MEKDCWYNRDVGGDNSRRICRIGTIYSVSSDGGYSRESEYLVDNCRNCTDNSNNNRDDLSGEEVIILTKGKIVLAVINLTIAAFCFAKGFGII